MIKEVSKMKEYDKLLEEVRTKIIPLNQTIRTTAKEYIPKMYQALCQEDINLTPQDARERIEKDCIELWSKRTILDALPDEAKNATKQLSGKQRKRKSAAMIAATTNGNQQSFPDQITISFDDSNSFMDKCNQLSKREDIQGVPKENIIDFEFSIVFKEISKQIAPLYKEIGDHGKVWFTGKIDLITKKVIKINIEKRLDN